MIDVTQWSRNHRSAMARWPYEPNSYLPALLLKSDEEPYQYEVNSFAILSDGTLAGRFSYRVLVGRIAFVGLVLSPAFRGRGLSVYAMRLCLLRLCGIGVWSAYGSVAMANKAALKMDLAAGFVLTSHTDWRLLPLDFDLSLLSAFDAGTYRLEPFPAMLYGQVRVELSETMYTGVAQQ